MAPATCLRNVEVDHFSKENVMYANVVVGIDGLGGGLDAAALARDLAPRATRLTLVRVELLDVLRPGGSKGPYGLVEDERSTDPSQHDVSSYDPSTEMISVPAASVGGGLHDVAQDQGADLTVIGSCHRSAVGRVLIGDDTRSVLHHARCTVAVAPSGYANRPRRTETIAVAYDGSDQSHVALAHAALLAADLGAKLLVHHVAQPHLYSGGAFTAAATFVGDPEVEIAAARKQLGPVNGAAVDVTVGFAREELAALSEDVDVLVCGSRHEGAVKRVVLGSMSEFLARHSACPLLVTPATDEEHIAAWHELRNAAAA
jgi:nucleotide-binding universal stress UspA family protein